MAQTLASLKAEAKQRANQESKTLVAEAEWNRYVIEAIGELYDLIVSVFPHYYVSSTTFTLSSVNTFNLDTIGTGENAAQLPFYKMRGVDYLPNPNGTPIAVRPFNFAERNRQGVRTYAIEGTNLMILPLANFSGTYTVWYTPQPPPIGGTPANFTVRLASIFGLPAYTAAGNGVGKTLTANVNGALTIDGVAVATSDLVLVALEPNPINNGIYTVTNPGSGAAKYVLTRATTYDQGSEITRGDIIGITLGNELGGSFYMNTTLASLISPDNTPLQFSFINNTLDSILDNWSEFITITAGIAASIKEQDAENVANLQQLKAGLVDRINKAAANREGEPQQAADLMARDYDDMLYGLY